MKFLKEQAEKRKAEYMSHVSAEVQARLADPKPIDANEWAALRANSYERELLLPKLDDNALASVAEMYLGNCQSPTTTKPFSTYDDAMTGLLVPLLIKRLRQKNA